MGFSTPELEDVHKRDLSNFQKIRQRKQAGDNTVLVWEYGPSMSESGICMIQMLKRWLQWYPKDSRGRTSFPTYQSLRKALMNAGFGNIVSNLWSYQDIVAVAKVYQD